MILLGSLVSLFVTEQMRQQQRALRRTQRDLDRDRQHLERQEKQLVSYMYCTHTSVTRCLVMYRKMT